MSEGLGGERVRHEARATGRGQTDLDTCRPSEELVFLNVMGSLKGIQAGEQNNLLYVLKIILAAEWKMDCWEASMKKGYQLRVFFFPFTVIKAMA